MEFIINSNLIQFLTNAAIVASGLFIPVLAKDFGATNFQIGIIIAAYNILFFITSYIFGIFSDTYGGKKILQIGLLASIFTFAAQALVFNQHSLLIARAFAGASAGIFPAALAVYAFGEREGKMGQFTGYASLGWAAGCILAGILGYYKLIFICSAVFFLIAFLVSLKFKDSETYAQPKLFPWDLLMENRKIYLPYFIRAFAANSIWAILPLYMMELGADKLWVGILYVFNVLPQFFFMQYAEKYRNYSLIKFGLLCTIIVLLSYVLAPSYLYLIPIQIFLALSFSALQVGVIQEILSKNEEKSTVMGILTSLLNVAAILGPLFSGITAELFGFRVSILIAAGFAAIAYFAFKNS